MSPRDSQPQALANNLYLTRAQPTVSCAHIHAIRITCPHLNPTRPKACSSARRRDPATGISPDRGGGRMALIPHARRRPWSSRSEFATLALRFSGGVVHGGAHRLVEMGAAQLEVQHCVDVAAGIRDG